MSFPPELGPVAVADGTQNVGIGPIDLDTLQVCAALGWWVYFQAKRFELRTLPATETSLCVVSCRALATTAPSMNNIIL